MGDATGWAYGRKVCLLNLPRTRDILWDNLTLRNPKKKQKGKKVKVLEDDG